MADQDAKRTLAGRIDALKNPAHRGDDFDRKSWLWLVVLGIALPVLLLVIGWWL